MVLLDLINHLPDVAQSLKDEYIDPALMNCNLLMSLINDILDFTRADFNSNAEIQMNYEPVNLRKIIKNISRGFSKVIRSRGVDFKCEVDENIPSFFNTDPQKLNQILNNLVGNSLKFTFEGFIKIEAKSIFVNDELEESS